MKKRKKKSVIKRRNTITLIMTIIICAIIFLLGLYNVVNRYLDSKNNNGNEGARPMFYASDNISMDIITPESSSDTSIGSVEYKVSLQNKSNNMTICKYNLYYYWDENPDGYYHASNNEEITLTGKVDDQIVFDNVGLNDYNLGDLRTLLSSYYIINDGREITNQTWEIKSYFHSGANQAGILNKTYPGKIGVEEVICRSASYLKDEELLEKNYICLGSDNEFCPDNNLYQVISVTDDGIKVVRTKSYGVSVWSEDLLPRISESFLKNEAKGYREIILDHKWPIYDEENLNIDMQSAYQHELSSDKKVSSKVGLLSLSDYKSLNFLGIYETPYTILSGSGLVVTSYGPVKTSSSSGFIYPVLYLDKNVVVSKGDGSLGNPYFIN